MYQLPPYSYFIIVLITGADTQAEGEAAPATPQLMIKTASADADAADKRVEAAQVTLSAHYGITELVADIASSLIREI